MTPNQTPVVTSEAEIMQRPGYQSLEPVARPPYWGVDLESSRRPGVPMERDPKPFPNTRYPPEPMRAPSAVPKHGRPNRPMPPMYGTALPLKGLSGAIRKMAYRAPDHEPRHWLLMMIGDRVEWWGYRARKLLPIAVPLAAGALVARVVQSSRRSDPGRFVRRVLWSD